MPRDRDRATLLDFRLASQQILEFIGDQDFESFAEDANTQSAVVLQILILGEASKRLSSDSAISIPKSLGPTSCGCGTS